MAGGPLPGHRRALVALTAAAAVLVLFLGACAAGDGSGDSRAWAPLAAPGVAPGADDSPDGLVPEDPGPQVMAEVTLPDGAVPSLPQPAVPPAAPATRPPVIATPGPGAPPVAAPSSVPAGRPGAVPGGGRALERLGSDRLRETAARALGLVRYDWAGRLPGWQLRFLPGRSGYRGSTFPEERVIEVYVRPADTPGSLAHVVAHEIGHAVDVTYLDDTTRGTWLAARGLPADTTWFPGVDGAADFETGAGDFAESFAHWQVGTDWNSRLGPPPDAAQRALLAVLARA